MTALLHGLWIGLVVFLEMALIVSAVLGGTFLVFWWQERADRRHEQEFREVCERVRRAA